MKPNESTSLIGTQREQFHQSLLDNGVLTVNARGVATNADKDSRVSVAIARGIADLLLAERGERLAGQTSGSTFEECVMDFVRGTFPLLQHLRPGTWEVMKLGNRNRTKTSEFAQYEHLEYLRELTTENRRLAAMIGNDYMVAPDVVVYRQPCSDAEINAFLHAVEPGIATRASLRADNNARPLLHASISVKWTIRSDRAQNSRTEALNLIRNRKGHLPHIVVVTAEPVPNRLASLALGTGDIDCVYHFALYELIDSVSRFGNDEAKDTLETLLEGRRLKDISDLPLDLCV